MSDLKKLGIKAFIWDFLGKFSIHLVSFIVTVILTKLLSPKDFGLIAIVMMMIGIIGGLFDLGLGQALIQRKKILEIHKSSVFYLNFFLSIIIVIFLIIFSENIALFFNHIELKNIIIISSLIIIFNALGTIHRILLVKELNYKKLSYINFIGAFLGGVVGIFLAINDFGIFSLVYQQIVSQLIVFILLWKISKWRPKFLFSFKALKQLWSFGFKMFIASFINTTSNRLDYAIIGKLFPIDLLGYYQRAKTLEQMVISYTSISIGNVFFPLISKIQSNKDLVKDIIIKNYLILIYIVFFLIGILFINSKEIILILFGEKWLQVDEYFKILILGSFSPPLASLLSSVLSSLGNSRDFLNITILKTILSFFTYIFLFFDIKYFLIGMIFSNFLKISINIFYIKKELNISIFFFYKNFIIHILNMFISSMIVIFLVSYLFEMSSTFSLFFIKISLFIFIFILISMLFKFKSISILINEIKKLKRK